MLKALELLGGKSWIIGYLLVVGPTGPAVGCRGAVSNVGLLVCAPVPTAGMSYSRDGERAQ